MFITKSCYGLSNSGFINGQIINIVNIQKRNEKIKKKVWDLELKDLDAEICIKSLGNATRDNNE